MKHIKIQIIYKRKHPILSSKYSCSVSKVFILIKTNMGGFNIVPLLWQASRARDHVFFIMTKTEACVAICSIWRIIICTATSFNISPTRCSKNLNSFNNVSKLGSNKNKAFYLMRKLNHALYTNLSNTEFPEIFASLWKTSKDINQPMI